MQDEVRKLLTDFYERNNRYPNKKEVQNLADSISGLDDEERAKVREIIQKQVQERMKSIKA